MSGSLFGRRLQSLRPSLVACLLLGASATVLGPAGTAGALEVDTTPAPPAAHMRAFDPADFTDAAAGLPPGLVEAVRRDLGMSAEEYLATAAATRLAGQVVASLGDIVRSSWLDGGTLHIAVADRSDAIAARATGAEVQVGDVLADALAAARSQDQLAYIDRTAGRVVPVAADVRGEPVGRISLLAQSAGHRGGSGFAVGDLLAEYHCSTGFTGTDAGGDARVLTAGHCGAGADGVFTSPVKDLTPPAPLATGDPGAWPSFIGSDIGEYVPDSFVFGDGRDAGLIAVTADDATVLPEVASWSPAGTADQDTRPLAVHDSIDAVAGAPACSAGVASGWSCGHLLDPQTTVPVSGESVTGFVFDACVLPGDSGGAVVVGNYALGINSGSTWRGPACTDGNPAADGGDISVGYAISSGTDNVEALYADRWDLLVHVGTPVVTAPADGGTVGRAATLTGTVDAAEGTTVTVRIDDGPTLEAAAGPAGRWSAPVGEPLEPGTYTYEITASHRAVTAGTMTTSPAANGSFEVADVAGLAVSRPRDGHVSTDDRPAFEGTGQPGATVALAVGDRRLASATVGDDGTWSLRPDEALDAGRFDAVLTQSGTAEPTDPVTVAGLGVAPGPPVVTSPRAGAEAGPSCTVTGVGVAGATVSARVTGTGDDGGSAASAPALQAQADDDGRWEIRLYGPLEPGRQVVVATQAVDGLTSEPSESVAFEVGRPQARARGDLGRDDQDDLAGTGSASVALLAAGGVLLAGGAAAAAVTWRRRRLAG